MIVTVLLSYALSAAVMLGIEISKSEMFYYTYLDIPRLTIRVLQDPEFIAEMLPSAGLGLVFAGLGCWTVFRDLRDEARRETTVQAEVLDPKR